MSVTQQAEVWFEADPWDLTVRPVRIQRETTHQIVLADGAPGNARRSKADIYFPTYEEACRHLLKKVEIELDVARAGMSRAEERSRAVAGLARPFAQAVIEDYQPAEPEGSQKGTEE